ncbi:MAG: phosphate/phosphite/phosphonate ABC transporter substrate-binding protein [Negativicutes bacterium]|nr:phosphate/phosphite/phosphonate ABC transporter substrate-binding protein [Negativicutes bacterium]
MKGRILMLLLCLYVLAGCSQQPAPKEIRLSDVDPSLVTATQRVTDKPPLRVAVSSILSPKETLTVYQPLLDYLQQKLQKPAVLLQRRTYQEVNDLLRNGTADVAFVCSGGYVAGSELFGMELLAQPAVKGKKVYQSYIIVPANSSAENIADLKGKAFAFTDPMSFSGRIAPVQLLLAKGFDSDTFFSRTFFTYSHDNSIKAVADGIADGAAVDSMIYDNALEKDPGLAKRTKVIERSFMAGNPPVVVSTHTDPALKEQLRTLLLTMHEENAGKAVLRSIMYDRFVPPESDAYAELRSTWRAVRGKL